MVNQIYPSELQLNKANLYDTEAPFLDLHDDFRWGFLSKFYWRHYDLVSKFNTGLKSLLHQGLSESEFYGDLVYKFRKLVGRNDFYDQFKKIKESDTIWMLCDRLLGS